MIILSQDSVQLVVSLFDEVKVKVLVTAVHTMALESSYEVRGTLES